MIDQMVIKLVLEREEVRRMIKDEIEALMRLGAEVTKMTYMCKNNNAERLSITPRNLRQSFLQNGSLSNVKRIHWIFYELPLGTHQDVVPQRRSHMDLVVAKVEHAMNITWAEKKEGETSCHRNCIQHSYSKVLNDKKQTIIKVEGSQHKKGHL
jgi:hypothetical protein